MANSETKPLNLHTKQWKTNGSPWHFSGLQAFIILIAIPIAFLTIITFSSASKKVVGAAAFGFVVVRRNSRVLHIK